VYIKYTSSNGQCPIKCSCVRRLKISIGHHAKVQQFQLIKFYYNYLFKILVFLVAFVMTIHTWFMLMNLRLLQPPVHCLVCACEGVSPVSRSTSSKLCSLLSSTTSYTPPICMIHPYVSENCSLLDSIQTELLAASFNKSQIIK
jgi:hypothetical protein